MNPKYAFMACAVILSVTGCQSYQRQPLDLADYASQWVDRSLDVEAVAMYAASLADDADSPAPFDSTDGLSLNEAEAVALHFNPQLLIARSQAGVPLAGAEEAGWWPDPEFQVQVLRYVDRGDKTRFKLDRSSLDGLNSSGAETTPVGYRRVQGDFIDHPWIVGAGLSITVPISGRLAVEKTLRWSQYSAAWRRILLAEWELLTRLRGAWLEWSTSQERLNAAREYVDKLESIAGIAQQLMAAGELKPTESRLLQIELARRRMNILVFEREVERQRVALHALLGLSPDAPVSLNPDVFIPSIGVQPDQRRDALLQNHPRIKSVEAEYETAEQQLRLEIRQQYPDLKIGPNYALEEGLARFGLGVGFALPLWNRNRQAIAESLAERDAAQARAHATVQRVLSDLAQAESRLNYASQQRALLLEKVAPLVDRQVEDSRTLLSLGEVDVLLLRDALTGFFETKLDILDVTLAEALAANTLQQMLHPRWFTPSQAEPKEETE